MARSDTRYSVYPAPKAVEVVGNSAPALNQAIECWAALLARATGDNAKTFWNGEPTHLTGRHEDMYALKEWCVLAEALKGRRFDPEFANPGELLATAVEDANRLEDTGEKWFRVVLPPEDFSAIELIDKCISELAKKLRGLDPPRAWAMILAVQWFWEHQHEGIDIKKDQWWTLAFRRQWKSKQASKTKKQSTDQRQGKRRKPETTKSN